jgi:pyruvate formate lyase activating enzyme
MMHGEVKRAGQIEDDRGAMSSERAKVGDSEVMISRRQFVQRVAFAGGGLCVGCGLGMGSVMGAGGLEVVPQMGLAAFGAASALRMARAKYWKPLANKRVKCTLCPKSCEVGDRERGFCGVRENRDGVYYTVVYGSAAAARPDPIEKKPFFHFLPGTLTFSIATAGCNMNCKDCQNWDLSQSRPEQVHSQNLPPQEVVRSALSTGCRSIAYTYSEPTVFYEYMYDTAVEGRARGVRSVVISSGYISQEPLRDLIPRVDAIKIDLKGFSDDFYRRYCSGSLQPVLDSIKTVHHSGRWLEIVVLIVPGLNDDAGSVQAMCKWLRANVGPDVPVHFSRFYPNYQLRNLPPTPYSTLQQCYKIARAAGLNYVYLGNVPESPAQDTFCPGCGKRVIERVGYTVKAMRLDKGRCRWCGLAIPGVWA